MSDKDQKKDEQGQGKKASKKKSGNVFDQGNGLLLQHAEDSRTKLGALDHISPGSSMLDRAEKNLEKEREKREGEDEAAQAALRTEAVRARDKVVVLMQQILTDQDAMQAIASIRDPHVAAIQIIEQIAPYLKDTELDALAAYDHDDLTYRLIIASEAYQEVKELSPQALKFGAFATVLWQMAVDELERYQLARKKKEEEEEEDVLYDIIPVKECMTKIIGYIRLVRSSDRL